MKVVFLDIVHPILEKRLSIAGFECIDATPFVKEECKKLVSDAAGIVVRSRFRLDAEFLSSAPNLKFIARSGAGMENIDTSFTDEYDISLFNAPEGNRNAVGEHALGMLLALFNKLHTADLEVRNGKWDRDGNRGVELDRKTVGLIGFGNNGSAFAKKLRGFDVEVLAYDKYKRDFGNEFVQEVELKDIFEKSDVLSFHIPQTDETLFMADEVFFDSFMKPIHLINLSRGKIVKTSALVDGLKSKRILGACLDVLEYEKTSFESFFKQDLPADFEYLLGSSDVILSPHVGGWTHESYFKLSDVLADKILENFKAS
ncbi:MAG: NAD(P)-dependent oxidoreductase [Crocinitomicaceae bacterium]|nr:NAD(P)-dependent oxidoreductase [Crocinitomicaceae bacterium]MDG1657782.1 NAD(P)-dependent oxidoreductase [Crocinitomicaceae bacterium]MDG2440464.1 NAD(P)-dependent oxidoreductase [Crocinitomicaceae bacterium]